MGLLHLHFVLFLALLLGGGGCLFGAGTHAVQALKADAAVAGGAARCPFVKMGGRMGLSGAFAGPPPAVSVPDALAASPRPRLSLPMPLSASAISSVPLRHRVRPSLALAMAATAEAAAPTAAKDGEKTAEEKAEEKAARKAMAGAPLGVHVIGLSHHNAKVEVREKLAVPEAEWNAESARLCSGQHIAEAAVLSTCNRFEVYIGSHSGHASIREAIDLLQQRSGLPPRELRRNLFILSGEDAAWHLLRVSAGLDSLVVGEGQILSQVRQCYLHGTEDDGSAGKVVSRLLNTAVSAGKRVRHETSIAKGAVSISSAAAEFSKFQCPKDLGKSFDEARLTIVGAGTMTRLLVIHLQSLGVRAMTIVNRSMPRCEELQEEFPDIKFDIRLADRMEETIMESDVVYTSTSATGCIVTEPQLRAMRGADSGKVMFVDISVPRNVESECNEVEGVFAYDVDDLKMVVARNTALRRKEMLEAEGILREESEKFHGWQQSLTAIPAISKMQEKFEAMRSEEVRKAANKLSKLNDKELEVVEKLSKGIVNKMLHGPMSALRQPEGPEQKRRTLQMLKSMFKLEKL